jgi:hypothetical protein
MYIPKTVLQAFRKFANAFLDRPIRKLASDIGIHATANGCTLQVSDAGKSVCGSVACKDGDEALTESVSISCDLFEELAQSTGDIEFGPVESTENGSRFVVRWQTGLAIRHAELDTREPPALVGDSIPLTNIGDRFLQCLAHAIEVTDEASIRYSLGCVQLDGRDGTMAATDGGHMVRFDGFDFPWKSEAVLVRKSRLFALKDFIKLKGLASKITIWITKLSIVRRDLLSLVNIPTSNITVNAIIVPKYGVRLTRVITKTFGFAD